MEKINFSLKDEVNLPEPSQNRQSLRRLGLALLLPTLLGNVSPAAAAPNREGKLVISSLGDGYIDFNFQRGLRLKVSASSSVRAKQSDCNGTYWGLYVRSLKQSFPTAETQKIGGGIWDFGNVLPRTARPRTLGDIAIADYRRWGQGIPQLDTYDFLPGLHRIQVIAPKNTTCKLTLSSPKLKGATYRTARPKGTSYLLGGSLSPAPYNFYTGPEVTSPDIYGVVGATVKDTSEGGAKVCPTDLVCQNAFQMYEVCIDQNPYVASCPMKDGTLRHQYYEGDLNGPTKTEAWSTGYYPLHNGTPAYKVVAAKPPTHSGVGYGFGFQIV